MIQQYLDEKINKTDVGQSLKYNHDNLKKDFVLLYNIPTTNNNKKAIKELQNFKRFRDYQTKLKLNANQRKDKLGVNSKPFIQGKNKENLKNMFKKLNNQWIDHFTNVKSHFDKKDNNKILQSRIIAKTLANCEMHGSLLTVEKADQKHLTKLTGTVVRNSSTQLHLAYFGKKNKVKVTPIKKQNTIFTFTINDQKYNFFGEHLNSKEWLSIKEEL